MTVSPLGGRSSAQEAQQLSRDKDNLLNVSEQIEFSNIDPQALISALERLQSENTRQITTCDEAVPAATQSKQDSTQIVVDQQAVPQNDAVLFFWVAS